MSTTPSTVAGSLIELLQQRGLTVATAESCTGGLVGKMLTDVPGSSEVYLGGWITYANAMKSQQLGVPMATIEQYGAVSEPVARAMAQGALERSGADLSVAVTGIAGPGGGAQDKPVGTVWFAVAFKSANDDGAVDTQAVVRVVSGDRQTIRDHAAKGAVQMLRLAVLGASLDTIDLGD